MASARIELEIVTPEKRLFSGTVDSVTVPGAEGALGILPGHAALLSLLTAGVLDYSVEGQRTRLFCGPGFVEVLPDLVSILADEAETRQEIDADKAGAAKARAEELLKSKEPETDYAAALVMLQEAEARLAVAQG